MIIKRNGLATESIILTFVQCFTYASSFIQVMILSRVFTKLDYGTYSQGNLIVHFTAPLLLLGLSNAANYFYNQNDANGEDTIKKYINTIYVLIASLGAIGGLLIIFFHNQIAAYFTNRHLVTIIYIFAFRPLFQNLISFFQVLYVASGRVRIIAVRNTIVSLVQLVLIVVACYFLKNVNLVCILLVLTDLIQLLIFHCYFNKVEWSVKIILPSLTYIKPILQYALPLALSTAVGTLSIHMDSLLIGRMMGTEDFAMYSNMAKELPLNLMIASLTTVIYPKIVNLMAIGEKTRMLHVYKNYVEFGILSTWILVCGTIVCGRELVLVLYSEKYINGLPIFLIYQLVAALRFTYYGTLLTANGNTKSIFKLALFSLVCNFALNIFLFYLIGIIGPAIATFVTVLSNGYLQIYKGLKFLNLSLSAVFDFKCITLFIFKTCLIGFFVYCLKPFIEFMPLFVRLVLIYLTVTGILVLVNKRKLVYFINELNKQ